MQKGSPFNNEYDMDDTHSHNVNLTKAQRINSADIFVMKLLHNSFPDLLYIPNSMFGCRMPPPNYRTFSHWAFHENFPL